MKKPRVLIIGGGFAGLNAAQALKKADVDIVLLDKTNHHLFQPLLYQVATAALSPGNIAQPLRCALAKQSNTTVFMEEVVSIDKEKSLVKAVSGKAYSFDYLILAPGARHSYFSHPEWESLAPGLKTLEDAMTIREKMLLSYERAERSNDPQEAETHLSFVIVGAGPTGVEMAGAISEISKAMVKDFRKIDPAHTKVYLIEGSSQVLPSYPKSLGDRAEQYLKKLGVIVLLNTFVTNVTDNGVFIGNTFLEASNIIWAAGNAASPLLKTLDTPLDKIGRVIVNSDLSVPGFPHIFVIGDATHFKEGNQSPLPGIAPVAIQEGRYVANVISKNLHPEQRKPFKYFDKGMLATIGKAKAVGLLGSFKVSGYLAWLAWSTIHIFYLISFANKTSVAMNWFYLYLRGFWLFRLIIKKETN